MRRLIVPILLALAVPAFAADIDVVRQNYVAYYTGAFGDPSSQRMRDALGALENDARNATAAGFLLSDGSWNDIDYKDTPDGAWSPWDHTRRLIIMARAYKTPGQALYRDPQLLAQINAALGQVRGYYGATVIPTGNWWFWTMGVPLDLGPTLVLMRGEVDQATYDALVTAIQLRIGNSPTSRGLVGPTPTGENLVWSSFNHLALALLKDDTARLALVRNAMAAVTLPTSGEGIKADSSFHQHGAQLYTGGYGGSFANDVSRYALITRGTAYALPQASLDAFSDYVADGIAWSLYGNYFDVSAISREVARPSTSGWNGLAALLQASQFPSSRTNEIRAAAAKMLQTWGGALPTELAAIANSLETARTPALWPSGHRHYFLSDYTVHRRNGWFASIKMFSTRTKSGEKTNNENLRGARQSDGRFYLVLNGNEYMGRDVWPAFDWSRLPGTTVEQKADTAGDLYGTGKSSFAGGTGDARNGVSAMEVAPLGSVLTAKKSWFFFDDAIVFLTNGITAPGTNRVETIVNQWPLMNERSTVTRSGGTLTDWAVLENVGYWFPTPASLTINRESRSGTWASLAVNGDTTTHMKPIVTMLLEHGTSPVNASAEYVIVPNVTADGMRNWVASAPLQIIANNSIASAVRDRRTNATGITFWTAGSVDGVQSDSQAVVYMTESRDTLDLYVADPNAAAFGTMRITIPGLWTTTDAPYTSAARGTTVTISKSGGRTTRITLRKPNSKRRAVR